MSKFKIHEVVFYKEDDDGNPIEDANGNVILYHDAFGKLVLKKENINTNFYELNVIGLSNGIYWAVVKSQNGVKPLKLIVN